MAEPEPEVEEERKEVCGRPIPVTRHFRGQFFLCKWRGDDGRLELAGWMLIARHDRGAGSAVTLKFTS